MTYMLPDPGFGPVESSDQCPEGNQCQHCAAGRPAAPDDLAPRRLYESVWELDDDVRQALPPAFHRPEFVDTCTPKSWFCNCCWTGGHVTSWPCQVAQAHGTYVHRALRFERVTAEHAGLMRQDVA
jgi:hypothetical protein